jgi:hypothetical protein
MTVPTFGEAYDNFRNGNGRSLHTTLDQLDLSGIKASDFKKGVGSVQAFNLLGDARANVNQGLVFGQIDLKLINENTVQVYSREHGGLPLDVYDFDLKLWTADTYKRDLETIGAGMLHGQGIGNTNSFIIWIYGTSQIGK